MTAASTVERRTLEIHAPAPPFSTNPSAIRRRTPVIILALVASIISVHLGLYQWQLIPTVWDPVFGVQSEIVLSSEASHAMYRIIGVPDAIFGAWAYLTEGVLALAGSERRWQLRPWLVLLFGLDVIALGIVSSVLVAVQGVALGAWCFPCLVTAAISLSLIGFAYAEVWATIRYLNTVWQRVRDMRFVWNVLWGRASGRALAIALDASGRS